MTNALDDLPDPGQDRFWLGQHQPHSTKTPLMLELREKVIAGAPAREKFSRLISKQGTIADPASIIATAEEILVRAGKVDKFTGILKEGTHVE